MKPCGSYPPILDLQVFHAFLFYNFAKNQAEIKILGIGGFPPDCFFILWTLGLCGPIFSTEHHEE